MKQKYGWQNSTIEQLENHFYGDPAEASTGLVKRCLLLCKTPVGQFTPEDLRLMIRQKFALAYLIPFAIKYLKEDIFLSGQLYRGDLLEAVLTVNIAFWNDYKNLWAEVQKLIETRRNEIEKEINGLANFDSFLHGRR